MSDPKPEEVKQEEAAPKEEKASPDGKKGQFSARGGRGGRNQAVKYVKKGEKDTEEEGKAGEHTEHKEHKEHKEYKDRKPWKGDNRRNKEEKQKEREKITLDTVIPEKPKKHEILKEPSEEEFHKQLNEIEDKIDAVYDRSKKFSKEMRDTQYKNRGNKDSAPLKDLFSEKLTQKAKINEEIKVLSGQNTEKKALIEDLFNKATKYRQKLKNYFKKDEIETALKELINAQKNGSITLQEEKVIIKEIAELEKALPFAAPLEVVTKELDETKAERKKVTDQLGVLFKQREALQKEIDELKTDLDNRKKEKDDVLKKLDPIIESKKEDYKNEVDELRLQKQKIKDRYHADQDAYYKQQQLLQDIEFKTKIKSRLIREEQRKQREAEEKLAEEEEKKETEKFNPHQEEINLCELLINYVQNLIPKTSSVINPEEKKQELSQDVQEDWKKQKFTVIQSKKESDGDFFAPKKKNVVKKKEKEEPVNEKQALHHQFEVLGYFEKLKVPPPLFVNKLEETVKLLKEKKDYYSGLSPEEGQKEKTETEEKEKAEERKPEPKKQKVSKHGIEVNETDFPSI